MDSRQCDALDAFRRLQSTFDKYSDLLGTLNASTTRKEFDILIDGIADAGVEHEAARTRSQSQTRHKDAIRESLLTDHMEPIANILDLHRFAALLHISGLTMVAPNASDIAVYNKARDMADLTERHRDVFVQAGLPPDYVEELRALNAKFEEVRLARDMSRLEWLGLTHCIDREIKRAWLVYRALKALARKALRRHPELMAELRRAKLHRPRTRPAARTRLLAAGAPAGGEAVITACEQVSPARARPRLSGWARVAGLLKAGA